MLFGDWIYRQTFHSSTILDLIFTNSNCISGVLHNNISDHFQVYALRKHQKEIKVPTTFKGRDYSNFDHEILREDIERLDWVDYDLLDEPNQMWNEMMQHIVSISDTLYPNKTCNINQQKDPWINDEIMHLIIEKDALLLLAKIENTNEAWRIARQAKNRTKKCITRARSHFIQNSLENNLNDSKIFWREINKILRNKKSGMSTINLKDQTTKIEISDKELPNYINDFFADIGPNLAKKIAEDYTFHGPIGRPKFKFTEIEPHIV